MRRLLPLFAGLVLGAGIGGYVAGTACRGSAEPRHEVRYHPEKTPIHESPEELLYPPGTTLEMIYPDEAVIEAIMAPDSVRIHRRGGDENLKVERWAFAGHGVEPDQENEERLLYALASLSAYEPPGKACSFDPGVLVRLSKNGRTHDLLFCFSCREMGLASPGDGGGGMSIQGARTYLKCFCDALPEDAELRQMREKMERR